VAALKFEQASWGTHISSLPVSQAKSYYPVIPTGPLAMQKRRMVENGAYLVMSLHPLKVNDTQKISSSLKVICFQLFHRAAWEAPRCCTSQTYKCLRLEKIKGLSSKICSK
jgi:hypothetical protein